MASSRRQGNGTTPTPVKQRSITSFFSPGSKPSPFTPPSASHSNPKPKLLIPPSSTPSSRDGPEAIGRRIRVFWPLDNQWYEGSVVSFDRVEGKHSIQYEDGEQEQLDLSQEKFEWADVSPPQSFRRLRKISGDDRSVSPDTFMEMVDAEEDGDDPNNADWGKDDRNVYEIAEKDVNGSSGETLRLRKRTKDGSCTSGSRDTAMQKRRIQALGRISGGRSPERNVSDLRVSQEYKEKHDQNSARSNNAGTGACARGTGTDLSGELLERFGRRELEKFGFLGKGRRDANGRKPGDENYDSRTLKLPTDFLKSLSGGQRQWWEFKSKHMDKVLFFKMGKFYELFEMDAHVGARELDLQYMKGEQPHCGFPEKNFEMFVEKLARKGYRVLVVEQTETPEQLELRRKEMGSKDKVVKREICAVVTKGTLVEGEMMSVNVEASYLMSVTERLRKVGAGYNDDDNVILGVCLVDASTSRFMLGQFEDDHGRNILRSLLSELRPVELIKPSNMLSPKTEKVLLENTRNPLVNDLIPGIEFWDAQRTLSETRKIFEKNASSRSLGANKPSVPDNFDVFGMNNVLLPDVLIGLENAAENGQYALSAFGGCLFYLGQALMDASLLRYARFELLPYSGFLNAPEKPYMMLDASALENLDIFESTNGSSTGTLFAQLDYCVTAFGKRLLKSWIARPLCDPKSIMDRQLAVSDLKDIALDSVVEFRKMLAKIPDMERLLSRLFANCETSGRNANKVILYEDAARKQLREFISALRGCQLMVESHSKFGSIKDKLQSTVLRHLLSTGDAFPDIEAILRHFKDAFDWSEAEKTGRVVPQEGVDAECDFACTSVADIENNLGKYLKEQQKLLGSNSVTYVTVGKDQYLLEVTEDLQGSIPPEYELHSSRKGYFRYWSPKLKMLLGELAIAEDEKESKLKSILQRLMIRFCEHHLKLRQLVSVIAELDVLGSLAISSNYYEGPICMPVILDGSCSKDPPALSGQCLGHPILKSDAMVKGSFVPNNVNIGGAGNPSFILLTGPNMGGKSTFLRQTCLAVILAQIGAYVPAESFHLSPVDRIFVRMGAKDHIMAGQSTFLTELSETATMMLCATRNSLVALDELGRGTSTSDGQAIAESVLDYFVSKIGCRGIFSTHYHRLAVKYANNPQVSLCHMACQVTKDVNGIEEVLFLYKLTPGACPKSYGVNVACLAGIPDSVLRKASSKSTSFGAAYGKRKNGPGGEYLDIENADGTAHLQDLLDAIVRICEQNVQTCKDPRGFLHEFQQKARLLSR